MKTPKILATAALALSTLIAVPLSSEAGPRNEHERLTQSLEEDTWFAATVISSDIRWSGHRQTPSETTFFNHLVSTNKALRALGEAMRCRESAHAIEDRLFAIRDVMDCAIAAKPAARLSPRADELFCQVVTNFETLEDCLMPRPRHHHSSAPPRFEDRPFEDRRPSRNVSHASREIDPRELIVRSIFERLSERR